MQAYKTDIDQTNKTHTVIPWSMTNQKDQFNFRTTQCSSEYFTVLDVS